MKTSPFANEGFDYILAAALLLTGIQEKETFAASYHHPGTAPRNATSLLTAKEDKWLPILLDNKKDILNAAGNFLILLDSIWHCIHKEQSYSLEELFLWPAYRLRSTFASHDKNDGVPREKFKGALGSCKKEIEKLAGEPLLAYLVGVTAAVHAKEWSRRSAPAKPGSGFLDITAPALFDPACMKRILAETGTSTIKNALDQLAVFKKHLLRIAKAIEHNDIDSLHAIIGTKKRPRKNLRRRERQHILCGNTPTPARN